MSPRRLICSCSSFLKFFRSPAGTGALFLVCHSEKADCPLFPSVGTSDEKHIEKSHGCDIGTCKRRTLCRNNEAFICIASNRRDEVVRNADTIGAVRPGRYQAIYGLS